MIIIYRVTLHRPSTHFWTLLLSGFGVASVVLSGCSGSESGTEKAVDARPEIVVTTPMLGVLVSDIVADSATVTVLMPNGTDPHSWEPSATDIEAVQTADLVVVNGLGLEENLEEAVDERRGSGQLVFDASSAIDEIAIDPSSDEYEEHPDGDPHYWTDASRMADVAGALDEFLIEIGLDVAEAVSIEQERLITVDAEIAELVDSIPMDERVLVTGHESMAYFADRYGFTVIGAVIPSQSSLAESSAGDLASLAATISEAGVPVIFTEEGTPSSVVEALASDVGVRVVAIDPVTIPDGSSCAEFLRGLAESVIAGFVAG